MGCDFFRIVITNMLEVPMEMENLGNWMDDNLKEAAAAEQGES